MIDIRWAHGLERHTLTFEGEGAVERAARHWARLLRTDPDGRQHSECIFADDAIAAEVSRRGWEVLEAHLASVQQAAREGRFMGLVASL